MTDAPSSSVDAAKVIDGRAVAAEITAGVADEVIRLKNGDHIIPGLAVVLVGDDPASRLYVAGKGKKAEEVGFHSVQHTLPVTASEAEVIALVHRLNRDREIHGILVQLPLPAQIDKRKVIEAIDPAKDVDGLHPINAGLLASGIGGGMIPCTPAGCLILVKRALGNDLAGRTAVVIGRSNLVGRPMAELLINESCTVTVAHSRTRNLPDLVRSADIVVAAVGKAELVRGDWIKPGAAVIDVGMNRLPSGQKSLRGDVAFSEAGQVAGHITPVPGGVGPMTIAMLMANTLAAAFRSIGKTPPALTAGSA